MFDNIKEAEDRLKVLKKKMTTTKGNEWKAWAETKEAVEFLIERMKEHEKLRKDFSDVYFRMESAIETVEVVSARVKEAEGKRDHYLKSLNSANSKLKGFEGDLKAKGQMVKLNQDIKKLKAWISVLEAQVLFMPEFKSWEELRLMREKDGINELTGVSIAKIQTPVSKPWKAEGIDML